MSLPRRWFLLTALATIAVQCHFGFPHQAPELVKLHNDPTGTYYNSSVNMTAESTSSKPGFELTHDQKLKGVETKYRSKLSAGIRELKDSTPSTPDTTGTMGSSESSTDSTSVTPDSTTGTMGSSESSADSSVTPDSTTGTMGSSESSTDSSVTPDSTTGTMGSSESSTDSSVTPDSTTGTMGSSESSTDSSVTPDSTTGTMGSSESSTGSSSGTPNDTPTTMNISTVKPIQPNDENSNAWVVPVLITICSLFAISLGVLIFFGWRLMKIRKVMSDAASPANANTAASSSARNNPAYVGDAESADRSVTHRFQPRRSTEP